MVAHDPNLRRGPAARVAVCIPAYGDPAALERTVAAVLACDHPRSHLQVVVAVDGPDELLAQRAASAGADDVVVLHVNRGSYAARNAAIERVQDDVDAVLFTDSDAEPDRAWIRAHLDALADAPRSGGAVRFELSTPPRPAEVVDARRHLNQHHYVTRLQYAATVNLAVRREVLDVLRFDETLRSGGDHEFGQRCSQAGFGIAWTPDAIVRHPARPTARQLLQKMDRVAQGARERERSGQPAAARRHDRTPLRHAAREHGYEPGLRWLTEAWLIDRACSVAFARRVPSVVVPAVRRRVRMLAR